MSSRERGGDQFRGVPRPVPYYQALLEAGIKIYRYLSLPSSTKYFSIDDDVA